MAATTMRLIGRQEVGASSVATIEFTSIPASFDDLYFVCSLRSDRASNTWADLRIRFNGASADTNHSSRYLQGTGAAAASGTTTYAQIGEATASTATASTFANIEVYIPNYAGSTNKSYSATSAHETNSTTAYMEAIAGLWSDTTAINAVKFVPVGNFVQYSSICLYGIKKS